MNRAQKAAIRRAADRVGALEILLGARDFASETRVRMSERGNGGNLPPPRLRTLVAGRPESDWFLTAGKACAETIREAAAAGGVDIADPSMAVLDFGCGCGRTSRHWDRPINGTDLNPKLTAWCSENLPGDYSTNEARPPTRYTDGQFDLVYTVSVFTHLTVERQREWLAELGRIICPGGLLVVTTMGDWLVQTALSGDDLARYNAGEIVVLYPKVEGKNLCAAYHPPGSIAALTDDFELVDVREEKKTRQDFHVLKRR
jgi:SAM-dependent methyltransferase